MFKINTTKALVAALVAGNFVCSDRDNNNSDDDAWHQVLQSKLL